MSRFRLFSLGLMALSLAVLRLTPVASAGKSTVPTLLLGNIHGVNGQAMEGVAVSARPVGGTVTTSVYTDEQGNYYFPVLSQGKYRVWTQAVGFEAGRAEVNLSTTRETHQDFTMKDLEDYTRQLTSPEWLASLPEGTIEDRRLKEIFIHTCTDCHSAAFALQNRFDEPGWRAILARMEVINVFGRADGPSDPIIKHYKGELAPYLARMRGPNPSPMKIRPYPRPTGDAARVVSRRGGSARRPLPPGRQARDRAAAAGPASGSRRSRRRSAAPCRWCPSAPTAPTPHRRPHRPSPAEGMARSVRPAEPGRWFRTA